MTPATTTAGVVPSSCAWRCRSSSALACQHSLVQAGTSAYLMHGLLAVRCGQSSADPLFLVASGDGRPLLPGQPPLPANRAALGTSWSHQQWNPSLAAAACRGASLALLHQTRLAKASSGESQSPHLSAVSLLPTVRSPLPNACRGEVYGCDYIRHGRW